MKASPKSKQWKSGLLAIVLVLALVLSGITDVFADEVTVDSFSAGNQDTLYFVDAGDTFPLTTCTYASATGPLGGHRDVCTEITAGDEGDSARLRASTTNQYLQMTLGDSVQARGFVQWDGTDANSSVATTGLSSQNIDLTDSGSNNGLLVRIVRSDGLPVELTLRIWTDSSNWAEKTLHFESVVGSGESVDVLFPFSSFVDQAGDMDPADVGAVELEIDATDTTSAGADITVKLIKATPDGYEYGDLPTSGTPSYSTSILNARHIPGGLRLGNNVDAEANYPASTASATGDDTSGSPDDEDGVTPIGLPWTASNSESLQVVVKGCAAVGTCYVNGWIDWNRDGDFDDTSERVISNEDETEDGTKTYSFTTPSGFSNNYYYARFRICKTSTACDSPDNTDTNVDNGNVEDYRWPLGPTAIDLSSFTADWDGAAVQVAWETAQEVDTLGFNLWRSDSAEGSYVQVNPAVIPAASLGGTMGGSYAFTDENVVAGKTYYYKLEELETGGARNWYGPFETAGGGNSPNNVSLSGFSARRATALLWPAAGLVGIGAALVLSVRLARRRKSR